MSEHTPSSKARRITANELAAAARLGVERALAARQSAFVELTPEQVEQVSGGATATTDTLCPPLPPIHGVVILPPIHGVIIKPPIHGVVVKPAQTA